MLRRKLERWGLGGAGLVIAVGPEWEASEAVTPEVSSAGGESLASAGEELEGRHCAISLWFAGGKGWRGSAMAEGLPAAF